MFRTLALILLAAPAAALDLAQAQTCIAQALTDKTSPLVCVDAAQVGCLDNAAQTPAVAILCFRDAQKTWASAMAQPTDPIAAINLKYAALSDLMQCDRLTELAQATADLPAPQIALQTERCIATAFGAAYARQQAQPR